MVIVGSVAEPTITQLSFEILTSGVLLVRHCQARAIERQHEGIATLNKSRQDPIIRGEPPKYTPIECQPASHDSLPRISQARQNIVKRYQNIMNQYQNILKRYQNIVKQYQNIVRARLCAPRARLCAPRARLCAPGRAYVRTGRAQGARPADLEVRDTSQMKVGYRRLCSRAYDNPAFI